MGDILLSPAAQKYSEERTEEIAKEQEMIANRDFVTFCEDRGVVPVPFSDFRFSNGGIYPINGGISFVSKMRVKEN